MENILNLGGKEFKVTINFRKSYDLTKYRNKISMGFDFSEADKDVVEEILKVSEKKNKGEEVNLSTLSPKAMSFLKKNSSKDIFSYDEIIDIVKILTNIEDKNEIEELLNLELQESDYDSILEKLIKAVTLVFTNVKGTSK